mgnify:CR=1 FL=1
MPSKRVNLYSTIETIHRAAIAYKANLVGKTFVYVFDDRYIEVIYKAINFKHLTGVESALSSKRFYSLALSNHLKPNQIYFSPRHPYVLCQRKLKHIEDLIDVASSENFMLEEIATQTKVYKFGTTDTKFTLCLTEDLDASGNLKSNLMTVHWLTPWRATGVRTRGILVGEGVDIPHGGISCRTHRQAALGQVFTPEPAI